MSLTAILGPELPFLRRYARALTGSQTAGDGAVRQALEALLAAPQEFDTDKPPGLELYRVFHQLWRGTSPVSADNGVVASLSLHTRQSLLLTAVEGFSVDETAHILGSTASDIADDLALARAAITDSLEARVMIIEDEAIIALHIQSIVEDLGHAVTGIARTRSEAVVLAAKSQPELVLADISLADGSSGIDAVRDILGVMDVPVIFITAFPERLLTGERPEPTYLITKPFEPETVTATIGQALFVHREQHSEAAALAMADDAPDPRKHSDTPEALLADPDLNDEDKQSLLAEWDSEMDGRLNAESEGMSASDPISHKREAALADEARHAKAALTEITKRQADA